MLTHSFIRSLTHSTHSFTNLLTRSLSHSHAHSIPIAGACIPFTITSFAISVHPTLTHSALTLTLTHALARSHSLALTHAHTRTHSLSRTLAYQLRAHAFHSPSLLSQSPCIRHSDSCSLTLTLAHSIIHSLIQAHSPTHTVRQTVRKRQGETDGRSMHSIHHH